MWNNIELKEYENKRNQKSKTYASTARLLTNMDNITENKKNKRLKSSHLQNFAIVTLYI